MKDYSEGIEVMITEDGFHEISCTDLKKCIYKTLGYNLVDEDVSAVISWFNKNKHSLTKKNIQTKLSTYLERTFPDKKTEGTQKPML